MKKLVLLFLAIFCLLEVHSQIWPITWDSNGNDDKALGIASDPSGNIIIAGYHHPSGNNIWRIAKYDASGTLLWDKTWDSGVGSDAQDVATDQNGNIYVCGSYPNPTNHDWKIIKYNTNGDVITEYPILDLGAEEVPTGITISNNNIFASGFTNQNGNYDWLINKYDLTSLIKEIDNDYKIAIYPNPANNTFEIGGLQAREIEIMDINGKVIKNVNISDTKTSIDISKLSSGVLQYPIQKYHFSPDSNTGIEATVLKI
ncbi:MAG: T9SS type A sorting domain-containing protein [Candidatus Falkowbacteria bacterium]